MNKRQEDIVGSTLLILLAVVVGWFLYSKASKWLSQQAEAPRVQQPHVSIKRDDSEAQRDWLEKDVLVSYDSSTPGKPNVRTVRYADCEWFFIGWLVEADAAITNSHPTLAAIRDAIIWIWHVLYWPVIGLIAFSLLAWVGEKPAERIPALILFVVVVAVGLAAFFFALFFVLVFLSGGFKRQRQ